MEEPLGTSKVVHWLKICLIIAGTQVQSLIRKLRSHMPWATQHMDHHNY